MPRLLYADTESSKQVHTNPFEWVPTMSVFSSYSSTIKYINLQALREKKKMWCKEKRRDERCLIFTLGGRAKCNSSLDANPGSFQVQSCTVELQPLSTWLKHGNTPCGVMGSVIKLLPHNGINYVKVQSRMSLVFAVFLNYFTITR